MKQKLALACTLVHEPDVILLDEPTTGVDPVSRREFWKLLSRFLASGITILMSTPYLDEAERCTRVALLDRGRLLALDAPGRLRASLPGTLLEVVVADPRAAHERCRAKACRRAGVRRSPARLACRRRAVGGRRRSRDVARRIGATACGPSRRRSRTSTSLGCAARGQYGDREMVFEGRTHMTRTACRSTVILLLLATPAWAQEPVRLTLDDAVNRALETSHRLAEANARVTGAQAAIRSRQAADQPTLTASGRLHAHQSRRPVRRVQPIGGLRVIYPDIPDNYFTRVSFQWPIYTGGRTDALERAAEAEARAATEDVRTARADLRLEVDPRLLGAGDRDRSRARAAGSRRARRRAPCATSAPASTRASFLPMTSRAPKRNGRGSSCS